MKIKRIPNIVHTERVLTTRRALGIDTIDDWRFMRLATPDGNRIVRVERSAA